MSSPTTDHTAEARLGACHYILHMLLQRMELQQPGCIEELIAGVTADRDGARGTMTQPAQEDVFEATLQMLRLANAQMKLNGPLGAAG